MTRNSKRPYSHLNRWALTACSKAISITFVRRLLLAFLLACMAIAGANAQPIRAKIVGITDGDTVKALVTVGKGKLQLRVRLDGIDAPEKAQPFGERSRQWLSSQVFQKDVELAVKGTDKYGRTLARIHFGGKDIDVESVRAGMSWWYRQYAGGDSELKLAEKEARAAKRGLWSDPKPTPPWQWRHPAKPSTGTLTRTHRTPAQTREASVTVYVTRTGHKFHRAGCRYLSRSQIPIDKKKAIAEGFSPCSVCGGG